MSDKEKSVAGAEGLDASQGEDTEGLRRTTRHNAGVPERKYGDPVPTVPKKYTKRNPKSTSMHIVPTPKSAVSKSNSELLKKQKEVEMEHKIAELETQMDENLKEQEMLEYDLKTKSAAVEKIYFDMGEEGMSEEVRKDLQRQLYQAKLERTEAESNLGKAEVKVKYDNKAAERKKRLYQIDLDLQKLQIDEESGSEARSQVDKTPDISKWVDSVKNPKNSSTSDEEERSSDSDGEQVKRMIKRLQDLRNTSKPINTRSTKCKPSAKGRNPHQVTTSEKMLARQTQGRDLPPFSGKPEEWPAFISAYENTTANCFYSNADNLPRLQKCLRDEALRTVQCLLINAEAVPLAINKLRMRFGRPTQIIESMVQKVRDIPSVKIDRSDTFIDFGIEVDNLVSTIKSLNKPEHLSNPTLIQELTKKLPLITQMDWIQRRKSDSPSLEDFAKWINRYTEAACELCPPKPVTESNKSDRKERRGGGRKAKERAFVANEDQPDGNNRHQPKRQERKCCFCEKVGHPPRECNNITKAPYEKRMELVMKNRVCFGCLNQGHRFKDCRSKRACGVDGCRLKHHSLVHQKKQPPSTALTSSESKAESSTEEVKVTNENVKCAHSGPINFMMVPVKLKGPDGVITGYAVLDSYASITAIEAATAKTLGLQGKTCPLNVSGFHTTAKVPDSQTVQIDLHHYKNPSKKFTLKNVRTVDKLSLPTQSVAKDDLKKWKHLEGLDIPTFDKAKPTIMIGLDNPEFHVQLEVRKCKNPNAPIAFRTQLGWMLIGRVDQYRKQDFAYPIHEKDDELHKLVKEFFMTESYGVEKSASKPRSREDERAQSIMDSTLKRVTDGWEIGLLWRDDDVNLPDSKAMALHRMKQMEKRMDRDPDFAKEYVDRIKEYQTKGFARILSPEEANQVTPKTFYIPHFMAVNIKKAKKYRFVFDAAAKVQGKSLNSHLLQGPDKLTSLPAMLLQFRQRKVAVTADIKDMFHRVKVRPEDAQSQRFLFRGMDRDRDPDVYEMGVLIFGNTCSPACAQEVKNRNAEEFKQVYPNAHEAIVTKHYVDDYLDCFDTVEQAVKAQQDIQFVHAQGGFHICNWLSSSREVMQAIPEDLRAKTMKNLDINSDFPIERVLGLFWKPDEDIFTFSLSYLKAQEKILLGEETPTKREVLSLVMSLYDPLGFLSILTIKAKIIIQEAWRSEISWDDKIPHSVAQHWSNWREELAEIATFRLARCYSPEFSTAENVQLHVFGDASPEAYGAVAYFRIQSANGVETSLVMAKAKVAPLKLLSVPRLELQSAVMGARMATFIKEAIKSRINQVYLWSDSTTVLAWVRADGKRFQQFVSHRIGEIQELSEVREWRWVPTEHNVADEMTRINKPCDWTPSSRWLNGPDFLKSKEEQWPKERKKENPPDQELRKDQIMKMQEEYSAVNLIIDITRFSKWIRLVRATAYFLRSVKLLKKIQPSSGKELEVEEIRRAEANWWRTVQRQSFENEVDAVQTSIPVAKKSPLRKINLMIDEEGVLRVRGRLSNANAPKEFKHPVVLSSKHPYTKLLISHYHVMCGHHGQERIGNEIRQLFFIPGLRPAVRSAQNRCQECSNQRAKPRVPEMGQLPKFRLERTIRPFIQTGLDYFGPVEVVVKRSKEKRYVALFTCLATRAIHLELVNSLSTDSCIMAIRRFVSRRGCPVTIHSDNGTNFKGTSNELKAALEEIDQNEIRLECVKKGFSWRFIPPASPHMGGSWERMVRSVKVALGAVLQSKSLKEEILQTVLAEAEHTVNSHPLTHVPDDPDDPEALTPNHFLIGRSSNLQPIGQFTKDDLFGRKHWRVSQQMADQFWRRWIKEFLPTLLRREKWDKVTKPVKEGDVIVEVNENLHRNFWPKGRVVKTYPGADGIVRVVDIKLANGKIYRRPVAKLCILDVEKKEDSTTGP